MVSGGFFSLGYSGQKQKGLLWQKTPFSPKLISSSSGVAQLDHISQSPLQEGVSNVAKFYPVKYGGEVMNATSRLGP